MHVRTIILQMLATQTMRPLAEHAGIAGEYAVEHFAEILAARMEGKDGPAA